MYNYEHCHALYMLPQDASDAAQSIDCRELELLPRNTRDVPKIVDTAAGADYMLDQRVQQTCVDVMDHAFQNLDIGKLSDAQVCCFKAFVVMISCAAKKKEKGRTSSCMAWLTKHAALTLFSDGSRSER